MRNHTKLRPWCLVASLLTGLFLLPAPLFAAEAGLGERLVREQCVTCHKFEGQPESKFNLKAPDLMWGGNKYQRPWLIRWLTGKRLERSHVDIMLDNHSDTSAALPGIN